MTAPAPLSAVLVGAGVMGRRYLAAYDQHPLLRITTVCDTDRPKAEILAAEYGVRTIHSSLAETLTQASPDVVIVATPDFAHVEPVLAALEHGCHVLCEKPLASTAQDARRLSEAAARASGQLMVNFGNRHRSSAQRVKNLVDRGGIGDVRYVNVLLNEKRAKTNTLAWRDRTSPLWFLLSHVVDLVYWITGDTASAVSVAVGQASGAEGPSTTAGLLLMRSGGLAVVESSWDMPEGYNRAVDVRLRLHGSTGIVELDIGDQGLVTATDDSTRNLLWDWNEEPSNWVHDWWNRSCHYFAESISTGREVRPNAAEGSTVVATLEAMQRSIDERATVPVPAER